MCSRGFTLLESLLVLSIVSIIISVTFLKFSSVHGNNMEEQFLMEFKNDILFAQQYALSTQRNVNVLFYPAENYYVVTQGAFTAPLIKRTYHPAMTIDTRTMGDRFFFLGTGGISKAGTMMVFNNGKERFRYIFTLGKGRFYVEEI
jgi:competence protein ComGD